MQNYRYIVCSLSTVLLFPFFGAGILFPERLKQADKNEQPIFENKQFTAKEMAALELPEIQREPDNPLFDDCHYCQKSNRLWYSSSDALVQAATVCGFDFLEVRIDQMFVHNTVVALTMVYCSIDTSGVTVDSVVYVQRNSRSSIKKVMVGASVQPSRRLDTSPWYSAGDAKTGDAVARCAEMAEDFRSFAHYRDLENRFLYAFRVGGSVYSIDGDRMLKSDSGLEASMSRGSPARKYYRLGLFRDGADCVAKNRSDSPDADTKIKVHDRYVYNQCIVQYDVSSTAGIASIRFQATNLIDKEVRYPGDKRISGSIPIGFSQSRSELHVTIVDVNGSVSKKHITIFEKMERERMQREQQKAVADARDAWARKSPLHTSLDFIGRFEGNIVSMLCDNYCKGKAHEYLLRIPDMRNPDCARPFALPVDGRAPFQIENNCGNQATYSYRLRLHAKTATLNGTRIAAATNPSLRFRPNSAHLDIGYEITLGDGYYSPQWKMQRLPASHAEMNSSVLLCSKAAVANGELTLFDIPAILDEPSNRVNYALVIHNRQENDSLLVTYIGIGIDRSKMLLFRTTRREAEKTDHVTITGDNATLHCKTDYPTRISDEGILLSHETFTSNKKLLALYVFVYSLKRKTTIGIGGLWNRF